MEAKVALLEEKLAALDLAYRELSQKFSRRDTPTTEANSEETNNENKDSPVTNDSRDDNNATTPQPRARIVHIASDEHTDQRKHKLPDGRILEAKELENTHDLAFTFAKYVGKGFRNNMDEIEIHDAKLIELLRNNLTHYPGHALVGDTSILVSPFESIILNWDKLEKITSKTQPNNDNDQAQSDLGLLLKTISESSSDRRLDQYLKTRRVNMEQKRVTFETLWTIFPPGEVIFGTPFQGELQAFVVLDNRYPWPEPESRRGSSPPWELNCWMYDWTGQRFLRRVLRLKIDRFEGAKPINSLPYYPLHYHENVEVVEDILWKRGKDYRNLCIAKKGEQMFHYNGKVMFSQKWSGDTLSEESSDDEDSGSSIRRNPIKKTPKIAEVDSTVMVDFLSYNRYGPGVAIMGSLTPSDDDPDCNCSECRNNDVLAKTFRREYDKYTAEISESDWTKEQFMLCPPRVLGFVLREKQWAQLQVSLVKGNLDDSKPPEFFLDKLKLAGDDSGSETKNLLMDLVKYHGGRQTQKGSLAQVDDIIPNKGKGLVILLYGPPGVGKTSTAETIAFAAKKPLFPVNVADVGTKAKYVEGNLEELFDLATTWEAILLIDESDVFLESRSRGAATTERNALVSVFLRVLEYYQGILFLTTNQIAQFDVAVQSRIHIALKYEPLNDVQTNEIFAQFLDQLNGKNQVKDLKSIQNWVTNDIIKRKAGFDGRQIRNIVSCAMNLARADNRKLERDDLMKVVDIVREFKTEFQMQFDRYIRAQDPRLPR